MNIIEGCISRFFYNSTEKYISFMLRDDNTIYKIKIPTSYMSNVSLIELTKEGDLINVVATEPPLDDSEPSTIVSWNNLALNYILKNENIPI